METRLTTKTIEIDIPNKYSVESKRLRADVQYTEEYDTYEKEWEYLSSTLEVVDIYISHIVPDVTLNRTEWFSVMCLAEYFTLIDTIKDEVIKELGWKI